MRIRLLLQALVVTLLWCVASLQSAGQPVDNRWLSEGYGLYFEVSGSALTAYEITAISCVPSFTAKRTGGDRDGEVAFTVVDRPTTYIFRSGESSNRRSLHMNGAASDIVVHRVPSAPAVCAQRAANTPVANFDVFAQTWAEQYGFFDLKHADWPAITSRHRERLSERTTPRELFQILRDMIEPFEDAHTSIRADDISETWSGGRKSATWLERSERPRAFEVTEQKYLRGPLRSWCNGQLQYGRLDSGVAYLRLKSFSGYGAEPGFESGLHALEEALDAIFAEAPSWRGLVIDVRINGGGDDPYGLAIASRLTAAPYVAYSKQARSDPRDATRWSAPQPSMVRPSSRPSFHGAVVELIGIHSVSAAETFTQALLKRTPKVTRIGENTQGVFSDVLGRHLPNGWRFGLPNERFVTDGKSYDGDGIAPDVRVPVFPKTDLDTGRDRAIEKALELLGV
jgi:Peptidase family S41